MRILIRETGQRADGFTAEISFGDSPPYAARVQDPFTPEQEERLGWYFEEWLRFPFVKTVEAEQAAASVTAYGEALFDQLFKTDPHVLAAYKLALVEAGGYGALSLAVIGSPAFHALHWEALKDPQHGRPLAVECPCLRLNAKPPNLHARVRPAPTLNVLLVSARPGGRRDVGYRTISRPLVEALETSQIRAQIDIVRPGAYRALVEHLERTRDRHGDGYYHLIHFDLHGALLTHAQFVAREVNNALSALAYGDYAQPTLEPFEGQRAFLLFEGATPAAPDYVADAHLADLLQAHQLPIAVLNACQSGKQVGAQETSLGSRLMAAGVQLVVAMGYSVTVSAAALLMETLYGALLDGQPLAQAIRRGRLALYNAKGRRAAYDQTIQLEDWLLPVVYQNRPTSLKLTDFDGPAAEAAYFARRAARYRAPRPEYGFVGRDVDILEIEKRLLRRGDGETARNVLLVQGMGGAGKTTLLRHLMEWWQTTRLVEQVIYFGYDAKAYTLEQIADAAARQVYGADYVRAYQQMPSEAAKLEKLIGTLRGTRHLLVLDNLESITGAALAIQHTLDAAARARLADFVARLAGGRTLVLLGSRGPEAWLVERFAKSFPQSATYELPGLDPEAASLLAERILKRQGVAHYRSHPDHRDALQQLLKLLDGYPLALEVVLANLAQQTPGAVLAAFTGGAAGIDAETSDDLWQDKTRSILRCVEYSHSNLAPQAQALLACLAPFTSVINTDWLPQYSAQLRAQPTLARLPFDQWETVLQAAQNWGLLTPHELPGYLRLQPLLPYFLRERLNRPAPAEGKGLADGGAAARAAVEAAFRAHYDAVGGALAQLIQSKEPQQRQLGQALIGLEYENLRTAMLNSLTSTQKFFNAYEAIFRFLLAQNKHREAIDVCNMVIAQQENYPQEIMRGEIGEDFLHVTNRLAHSYLQTQGYDEARQTYEQFLALIEGLRHVSEKWKETSKAGAYHQLGIVAQEQRQWATAERYYQQALQLKIEFNDRYSQALTLHGLGVVSQEQRKFEEAENYYQQALALYIEFGDRFWEAGAYHQLGSVAEEQRQWATAERYYQQALQIYIDFNDRYEQAGTYHQLGIVAQEQRQWATAERYYQQALQIKIEFNDRYSQASTTHQLGMVAQAQRQWAPAERYYQQALQLKIEFNDRYSQAGTYHQLGIVAQEQRQWATAERYYQQALQLKIEFNDRYSQGSTYGQLGLVAEANEQWAEAANYALQALQIFADFKDDQQKVALSALSRAWQATQDAALPARVAAILGVAPAQAREMLGGGGATAN